MSLGDSLISPHVQDKLSHCVKYNNNDNNKNIYAGSAQVDRQYIDRYTIDGRMDGWTDG
jgi:hypothetical protein